MLQSGIEVPSQSYASIEAVARNVRRQLGLKFSERINAVALFESLDECSVAVSGRTVKLDYAVSELSPGIEALARYNPEEDKIDLVLSEETYRGLEIDNPRDRFSLCHEIGHSVLHPAKLMRLANMGKAQLAALYRGMVQPLPTYKDSEWQAEAFSAAFLMPADGLLALERERGGLTHQRVMDSFVVSAAAAETRLRVFRSRRSLLLK
jgi:hypothetical protein